MSLHIYGLLIGIAIVVGLSVAERVARASGHQIDVWDPLWWMATPAVAGARAYHVVDKWSYYAQNPLEIIDIAAGGLAIYGAIFGAVLGLLAYLKAKSKNTEVVVFEEFFVFGDVYALVLPLAQAIGRWGNYVNGELWGVATTGTPWEYHPLFLYESVLNLALFVILILMYRRKVRGSTLGGYLVGYGVIRIVLEPLRQESFRAGGVAVAQLLGVLFVIIGILILVRRKREIW